MKKFFFKNIKSKLIFIIILLIISNNLLVLIYSNLSLREEEKKDTKQKVFFFAEKTIGIINSKIKSSFIKIRTLSQILSLEKNKLKNEKIDIILKKVLYEDDNFQEIYIFLKRKDLFDEDENFISHFEKKKNKKLKRKKLENYKDLDAYEIPKKTLSKVLLTRIKNENLKTIELSVPIIIENVFYGIIAVHFKLDWVQENIFQKDIFLEKKSDILLLNDDGFIIAKNNNQKAKNISKFHKDHLEDLKIIKKGKLKIEENHVKNKELEIIYPIEIADTEKYFAFNIIISNEEIFKKSNSNMWSLIFVNLIIIVFSFIVVSYSVTYFFKPLSKITKIIENLSIGNLKYKNEFQVTGEEINKMKIVFQKLIDNLNKTTSFAKEVGKGNFDIDFVPFSKKDILGTSLIEMRENLKFQKKEEELRKLEKIKEEWNTRGINKFSEILRQHTNNVEDLSYSIIQNLVKFLNANQGGIFIYKNDNDKIYLEQIACFAYDRKKFNKKSIEYGEGLIGICAIEKEAIYLNDIPNEYLEIESGLGNSKARSILIIPMITEDDVIGVMEIASFKNMKKYERKFAMEVAENTASTFSIMKINNQKAKLLEETQKEKEEMFLKDQKLKEEIIFLEKSEEDKRIEIKNLKDIFYAIENLIFILELDKFGKIIYVNDLFAEVFSMRKKEIINKNFSGFSNMTYSELSKFFKNLEKDKKIIKDQKISFDGLKINLIGTYTPIFDKTNKLKKVILTAKK